MKIKIRLKYSISFALLGIVTYWNWVEIPIQDNFVSVVKWITLMICAGFSVKKIVGAFRNNLDDFDGGNY